MGFTNAKFAEGLSPRTLKSCVDDVANWLQLASPEIVAHLAWLHAECQPCRSRDKTYQLSRKTIGRVSIAMSSFFGWTQRASCPTAATAVTAPSVSGEPDKSCPHSTWAVRDFSNRSC